MEYHGSNGRCGLGGGFFAAALIDCVVVELVVVTIVVRDGVIYHRGHSHGQGGVILG